MSGSRLRYIPLTIAVVAFTVSLHLLAAAAQDGFSRGSLTLATTVAKDAAPIPTPLSSPAHTPGRTPTPTRTPKPTPAPTRTPTPTRTPRPTATPTRTPTPSPTPTLSEANLYVLKGAAGAYVNVYPAGSDGDTSPIRTISSNRFGGSNAFGIALDAAGNIYLANTNGDSIIEYSAGSDGNVAPLATISGPNTGLDNSADPMSVAVDSRGNIYAAGTANGAVMEYPAGSNGNVAPIATISNANSVQLVLDRRDNLYVLAGSPTVNPLTGVENSLVGSEVDTYPAGIHDAVRPTSRLIINVSGGYEGSSVIALDSQNNLYVAVPQSSGFDEIRKYTAYSTGLASPIATIVGENTFLDEPLAITVDSTGNIYVANGPEPNGNPLGLPGIVMEFASGSEGNVAPIAVIQGPNTDMGGLAGLVLGP
jgi:hypothetical protein